MNTHGISKSSLMLIEIIINILFFFILLAFILKFFVNAQVLSQKISASDYAVLDCENASEIFKSSNGTYESFKEIYTNSVIDNEMLVIYFDKENKYCSADDASYILTVSLSENTESQKSATLKKADICFSDILGNKIHEITSFKYNKMTLKDLKGGN